MRLIIDGEEFCRGVFKLIDEEEDPKIKEGLSRAWRYVSVENLCKVEDDVAPVKYGYWVETTDLNGGEEIPAAMCSECNESWVLGEWTIDEVRSEFKYCPWCGARMLEVEDEEERTNNEL